MLRAKGITQVLTGSPLGPEGPGLPLPPLMPGDPGLPVLPLGPFEEKSKQVRVCLKMIFF